MNILMTVLARGGSKGVPSKNIKDLYGKPLIHYTLEQARDSKVSNYIAVSSDSDKILQVASQIKGIETVKRPAEFANDTVTKLPGIRHAVEEMEKKHGVKFELVIDLDPTSPLREVEDIQNSLNYFLNSSFDSLITGCEARRSPYFNLFEKNSKGQVALSKKPEKPITCRQDSPECFDMNGSVYIWKRFALFDGDIVFGPNMGVYVMPPERSIDIDHPIDFEMVEFFMGKRLKKI